MADKYKDALHEAQQELARLEERRATLLKLIQNLKELSDDDKYELSPPPDYVPKGLTEEIRTILTLTTLHLDAMQIRDALIQRGFEYRSPKHLLINVHTVLGRIKNELDTVERDGKIAYKKQLTPGDFITALQSNEKRAANIIAGIPLDPPPSASQPAILKPVAPPPGVKRK